ncbi:Uncharacterised protein [Kluyvera intermedia]|nr:Uncharacterised protein [Kluyvera intermedia]
MVINNTSAVQIIIKALSALSMTAGAAIRQTRQQCQCAKPRFYHCFFHHLDPYHCAGWELQRRFVGFAGTNTDYALQFGDKNLTVANFSGVSGFADHIDDFIELIVGDSHINLYFRQEVDAVFRPRYSSAWPF